MQTVKKAEGICPKCQSENINYGEREQYDKMFEWDCTCRNCGLLFTEVYELVYCNTQIPEED
jgi:hypothetical protein